MQGPAAPASGTEPEIPTFAELAADPEIAPLLDFVPVPRKTSQPNGWTAELQCEFIARLAQHGSITKACREVEKERSGAQKLYNSAAGASFRSAWHDAVELAKRRQAEQVPHGPAAMDKPPTIDRRRKHSVPGALAGPQEGQVLNEHGEWEDEASYRQRGEDARDSVAAKLLRARRLYLREISECPAKRAAFEILSGYAVDWDKAALIEPQPDEPWRAPRLREPDYVLTAEAGWLHDLVPYGPDKITQRKAELRQALDEYHAEHGLPPIEWEEGWGE